MAQGMRQLKPPWLSSEGAAGGGGPEAAAEEEDAEAWSTCRTWPHCDDSERDCSRKVEMAANVSPYTSSATSL
jgi:hypothetical protein